MPHYLDYAATTPTRREAAQAAVEAMTHGWGNPSSTHGMGEQAAKALKDWRQEVAWGLGCEAQEVYFTSGGTEGNNWAILEAARQNRRVGKHILTTALEHDAVLGPCRALEEQGYEVQRLLPDREGNIAPDQVAAALRPDTALVSMMLVNNELGTLLPVDQCAQLVKKADSRALLHCDAVQGFLKVPFTPAELGVDLLTVSGHKIHAPKGVGALYLRGGLRLGPLLRGGGQESGLRPGTEATGQIAAFAAAVKAGRQTCERDIAHMRALKDYAIERLSAACPKLIFLSRGDAPHILPISLPGYQGEVLVRELSDLGIFVSSGSACHKGKPSHVYAALRRPKPELDGALRVSLSYESRREDIDALAQGLAKIWRERFPALR